MKDAPEERIVNAGKDADAIMQSETKQCTGRFKKEHERTVEAQGGLGIGKVITIRDVSSGNKVEIEVEDDHMVSDIVETVADHFKMAAGDYWLRKGKRNLDPHMTVASAGLQAGDFVELIPNPVGGLGLAKTP